MFFNAFSNATNKYDRIASMKYIFLLDLQSYIPPTITKIVEVFSVHKTKKAKTMGLMVH